MAWFSRLLAWLRVDRGQPTVVRAQFRELRRQIPLLYALLCVNALAVAYTHYGIAPAWLTVCVPALLVLACVGRLLAWLKLREEVVAPELAAGLLQRTVFLGPAIAAAYVCWSLVLNSYGGAYQHAHVAIFIAVTVIGCIFCLMHLPQAALAITAVVTAPYLVYYLSQNEPVFTAIALNILLVTAVMVQVLLNSFRGFTELIRSQTETERLSQENRALAFTDALTGLPNRRGFFAELEARIEHPGGAGTRFAVGVFDLDRFKPINDTYGHVVGDRLLEQVGERLKRLGGDAGLLVARLGGDEFGFLVAADGEEAEATARRVCEAVSAPNRLADLTIAVGCSCGIAVFPDAGRSASELFDRADYALYSSKASRRGTVTLYSGDHETRIRSEQALEAALQTADLGAEMDVHLQPIVDANTGAVVAAEALARWTSPTLGKVRPDSFIPVAERVGLMHALTLALFRKSLDHLRQLPTGVDLSFNLSAHDVTNPQTIIALVAAVRRSSMDPGRITFELTETAVMRDVAVAARSMQLLRALGAKIAIDDFGTGHSSLGYLHRLPIDKIKIDRSFVLECDRASGRDLLASIMGLCATMRYACVVEGVEEAGQLAVLRALGGRMFQGYLFAPPMPLADLLSWIETRSLASEAPPRPLARSAPG